MSSTKNSLDGDELKYLPVDTYPPTANELGIVNAIFKKPKTFFSSFLSKSKTAIFLLVFFILFSLPQTNSLINKIIPIKTDNIYISILVRGILFVLCYLTIKHIYKI